MAAKVAGSSWERSVVLPEVVEGMSWSVEVDMVCEFVPCGSERDLPEGAILCFLLVKEQQAVWAVEMSNGEKE